MQRTTLAALALAATLAGCGAPPKASPSGQQNAAAGQFALWAPAHPDGATLEQRHAGNLASNPNCVGQNTAPALRWANPPAGTRSLALLMYDQEGRNGLGVVHWVAYGIAPSVAGFDENEIAAPSPKYVGGKSTLNLPHYMGPCPPANTGHHHYVYTLIATDVEPGALPPGLTMPELLERLNGRAKGGSSIVLRYGRP